MTHKSLNFKDWLSQQNKQVKSALISTHYSINKVDKNQSDCKVQGCTITIKSNKPYNLLRHLYSSHLSIIHEFIDNNEKERLADISRQNIFKPKHHQLLEIKSYISRQSFEKNIIDILKTGVSFRFFDSIGFQNIIKDQCVKFNRTINRKSVIKILEEHWKESVEKITSDTNDKLINIKLDGVSVLNRYFLGINIQYFDGSNLVIRNIGLEEIIGKSSAEKLKEVLKTVLSKFEISLKQVFSVVTDNGSNYIKIGKLLNQEIFDANIDQSEESSSNTSEKHTSKFEIYDLIDIEEPENILESINETEINIVKCGCHTLQLAIYDSIKAESEFLSEIREIIKLVRTHLCREKIELMGLNVPKIDTTTRWNSTFHMVKSFISVFDFVKDKNIRNYSSERKITLLTFAETFVSDYDVLEKLTLKFQTKNLLYSDFAYSWISTLNHYFTKRNKSDRLETIYEALLQRSKNIIGENIAIASLYLDPTLKQYTISNKTLLNDAKSYIKGVFIRFNSIILQEAENNEKSTAIFNDDFGNILNSLLTRSPSNKSSSCHEPDLDKLNEEIKQYDEINYGTMSALDPIDFWLKSKKTFVILHKIAVATLTVPSSQVSVERLFSQLNFMLNPRRSKLNEKNVRMLLHVAFNN